MSGDNNYEKKMKYKTTSEGRKLRPTKNNKKEKQNIKNTLRGFDISSCDDDDFLGIDDFYWEEG